METKLTLSMDVNVINKAKDFARRNHTSLSKLIEDYFSVLTSQEKNKEEEITPLVKNLSGIVQLPKDFDYKKDRTKYLEKKYK